MLYKITFPGVLCGCGTWAVTFMDDRQSPMALNDVLRIIFGRKICASAFFN
jgi:hypothetical protein